jgi:hypothetical protein
VWQLLGRPTAVVNMSYTLAKTVSVQLQRLVSDWEKRTGQTLQSTDTIEKSFRQPK